MIIDAKVWRPHTIDRCFLFANSLYRSTHFLRMSFHVVGPRCACLHSLLSAPSNFPIARAEHVSRTFICLYSSTRLCIRLTSTLSASRVNLIQESRRLRQNHLCHQFLPHGVQIVPLPYHFDIVHVHETKESHLHMRPKNITIWFLSPIRFLTRPFSNCLSHSNAARGCQRNVLRVFGTHVSW